MSRRNIRRYVIPSNRGRFLYVVGWKSFERTVAEVLNLESDQIFVIYDRRVAEIARVVGEQLGKSVTCQLFPLTAKEADKSLRLVERVLGWLIGRGATRRSVLLSVGGGFTSNVVGLSAALLYRGVRFVQIPTTLVGILDSSMSIKQAVNASNGKNLFGAYHAPSMVISDLEFVQTLSVPHVRSGVCELAKFVLSVSPEYLPSIRRVLRPESDYGPDEYWSFLDICVSSRVRLQRSDPCETKQGIVFEYGHTVGHGLELLADGKLSHGESIGIGMRVAARTAHRLGLSTAGVMRVHDEVLAQLGLDYDHLPAPIDAIVETLRYDNKNGYLPSSDDRACMVLLGSLGAPRFTCGLPLVAVKYDILRNVLRDLYQ